MIGLIYDVRYLSLICDFHITKLLVPVLIGYHSCKNKFAWGFLSAYLMTWSPMIFLCHSHIWYSRPFVEIFLWTGSGSLLLCQNNCVMLASWALFILLGWYIWLVLYSMGVILLLSSCFPYLYYFLSSLLSWILFYPTPFPYLNVFFPFVVFTLSFSLYYSFSYLLSHPSSLL